ncbi:MAG: FAD-dependent oxidoreductase [Woeseiaceae bacterium]
MTDRIVIAGAGHAAGQVIATLRQEKFGGQIVLIGDEPYLPYQRPPLSKKFLAGEMPAERLFLKPAGYYDDPQIELRLDTTITAINTGTKTVSCENDDAVAYDKLILALGSRARTLAVDGVQLEQVHYLRSIADVESIRAELESGRRLVIVGGGYIGLEVAAVARSLGLDVTVVEMADRVMSRVVSPEISDFFQLEHTSRGVRFRLSTRVKAFAGKKRLKSVVIDDGEELRADLVVIGAGILPNVELARHGGLEIADGIVVDDRCRTSDPDVYAVGDCTVHPNGIYGRQIRLESVHNALEQAKTAARNICGKETHYCEVPWFWSDQFDLKLQIAGLSKGYDDIVIRGNPADRSFACLYLREGRLLAVDAVNSPKDFMQSKPLIAAGAVIPKERLSDTDVSLKELG